MSDVPEPGSTATEPEALAIPAPDVAYVVPAPMYDAAIAAPSGVGVAVSLDLPEPGGFAVAGPSASSAEVLDSIRGWKEELAGRLAPLDALGKRLDQLQATLDRDARAESTREKVVDRLHHELQQYKDDLLLKVLRPVFVDLIQLHDDMGKMIDAQGPTEGEASRLLDLIRGFQQGVEDILYRQGVEPFSVEESAFDPRRQRAVQTVATDDPALNKTIAGRHRKGFLASEKVIRPEIVSVYALKK